MVHFEVKPALTSTDDFVLKGLNLTINPNESVALVGESGCGKSTFVNMMMRFYDPNFGDIFLDDVNIKEINLHDLRKVVSLVMQEPSIFNYSIMENILNGNLTATNTQIMKTTEQANFLLVFAEIMQDYPPISNSTDSQPCYSVNLICKYDH